MEPKWHTGLLMLAVVIGAVLRVPGMGDALNHDEVYTWEAFASQSFATIATHYPVPNNHVFHSMLVRLASLAFGQSEAALRSPAFISGLLAIPAVWVMVRVVLQSATGAAVAAWIMALAPVHIRYSASARGYSMMILLSVLALLCLWQAMGGHARSWIASPSRLWWGGWAGCAFLAAYTVPSAGLFVLAAGGWALVDALRGEVATRRQRLVPLVYSSGIALIGIVGAYWPIRSQMAAAGAHFGVDLDADPSAVLSLAWQTLSLVTGGWSGGIALALAALGGAVIMARRTVRGHGRLLLMSAMILLVPIAASFVYGTAPQARGLIFLLPVIVLLGSYSVCQLPSRSLQIAAVVAVLAGQVHGTALIDASAKAGDGCRALGRELIRDGVENQVIVSPYIMDLELWHYAKQAIQTGLVTAAVNGQLDRVVFATDRVDARFDLGSYHLSAETTGNRLKLALPRRSFDELFSAGSKSVFALTGEAERVLDHPLTWQSSVTSQLLVTNAANALSAAPAIQVLDPSATGDFRLYSQEQFAAPGPGLAVLLCARTERNSEVSLYLALGEQGEPWQPAELHMCVTAAKPVKIIGHDGQLWYLEAFIVPILEGRRYGLYIRGGGAPVQGFAELAVYCFPWKSDET